jgi:hypothetical protein
MAEQADFGLEHLIPLPPGTSAALFAVAREQILLATFA